MHTINATLGDLISAVYEEYLEVYGDEDVASVAAAATINEMLLEASTSRGHPEQEEAA